MPVDRNSVDLSALPGPLRDVVEIALERGARADALEQKVIRLERASADHVQMISDQSDQIAALKALTEHQKMLIAELKRAVYGKRSEKLPQDQRDLRAEDLEVALGETEIRKDAVGLSDKPGKTSRKESEAQSRASARGPAADRKGDRA